MSRSRGVDQRGSGRRDDRSGGSGVSGRRHGSATGQDGAPRADRSSRPASAGAGRYDRADRGSRSDRGFATADRSSSSAADPTLPPVPEDVDVSLLDRSVRAELRSLSKLTADAVSRYLVAAGLTLESDPARALAFAHAARARGARVAAVREAVGIAAYHAGEWAEALTELRTARRISGDARNLPLMADCERALGRPAQAIRMLDDPGVGRLDHETRRELFIVVAGARRDAGQLDAALAVLARGGLDTNHPGPGSARLWYAYADALEVAGRVDEAARWFAASAAVDPDGELDAAERAADLL